MYEEGGEALGVDVCFCVNYSNEDLIKGRVDPSQGPLPTYGVNDGVLAPKPMQNQDGWEPMGDLEYSALYYALCKFNQINRTGVEYKTWGPSPDEIIYSYPDTSPHYYLSLHLFLDVFSKICGPTARKIRVYRNTSEESWEQLVAAMRSVAAKGENPESQRISLQQFLEMMKYWAREIGVPKDIHAAFADFVPNMCNLFRLRKCVVATEYDSKLIELGGEPFGAGMPDLPRSQDVDEPRGDPLPQALLFDGDGSQKLGMIKSVATLPEVQKKLEVAKRILGFDLLDLCVNGPSEKLESLEYNGVAIYMAGWAAYEKLLHENRDTARRVQAVAGLEVGEYVALSVAGVISFEAGLELALARGTAMKELAEAMPDQGVCSVAGLTEDRVKQLCDLATSTSGQDVCQITTVLFPKGYVVGGKKKAVETFKGLAEQAGAKQAKMLEGQKANHSPLMHHVQWSIKAKLQYFSNKVKVPWCDVYLNASNAKPLKAGVKSDRDALAELNFALARYLSETCWSIVRWDGIVQSLIGAGIKQFYECGPSKQLKALMKLSAKDFFDKTTNVMV